MVLSSQVGRGGPRRYYTTRRRRAGRRPWIILGLILVALVIGYQFLQSGDQPGESISIDAAAQPPTGHAEPSVAPAPSLFTSPYEPSTDSRVAAHNAPTAAQAPAIAPVTANEPAARRIETAAPAEPPPATPLVAAPPRADAPAAMRDGMTLIAQGDLLRGRAVLSRVLLTEDATLEPRDAQAIRDTLSSVNRELVFSDRAHPDDPLVEVYTVKSGDLLAYIAPRYKIPYQLIERLNHVDARRIRPGQQLKVIRGPFHAVVHKSAFRMDVLLADREGKATYICSFPVGLGTNGSTPIGQWTVRDGSKIVNPSWTHPETNQYFAPDNPDNPIGEHWLGLQGLDDQTKGRTGYGIHGTIDPSSIGRQMSLGCIRMRPQDVATVYDLLVERYSTVQVRP